jgi:hypothetical protein
LAVTWVGAAFILNFMVTKHAVAAFWPPQRQPVPFC